MLPLRTVIWRTRVVTLTPFKLPGHALQAEAVEVDRDVARGNFDAGLSGDAVDVRGKIIGTRLRDLEETRCCVGVTRRRVGARWRCVPAVGVDVSGGFGALAAQVGGGSVGGKERGEGEATGGAVSVDAERRERGKLFMATSP